MFPHRDKIQGRKRLSQLLRRLRAQRKKIVFTNGCFDILHAGHVTYLERAKRLGSVLVVGLNSDSSVKRIKGRGRPVNSERDRLRVLAALEVVDYVTLFSEETPLNLICELRPHILVKGADWKASEIAGAKEVRAWGGRVKRVRLLGGRSTTFILEKIRKKM